jgi:hypothetical protein
MPRASRPRPYARARFTRPTIIFAQLAAGVAAVGVILILRAGPAATAQQALDFAAVAQLAPAQLKAVAADKLEALTAKGGAGYRFEIVQTSTIHAKPDGPKVEVPDPVDPHKTSGLVDEYRFYSLIERGIVTPGGFWSEVRVGPEAGAAPDFEKAELRRSALVKDGIAWRNDREGWYHADGLPGIGLDPETARLLPTLLRDATEPTAKGTLNLDGKALVAIDAAGTEADIPGLVVAGGVDSTRLTAPIEFGFDSLGRLARIHALALNTTMTDYDLVVDTVIAIRYDQDVGSLPEPAPTWVPSTAPQQD